MIVERYRVLDITRHFDPDINYGYGIWVGYIEDRIDRKFFYLKSPDHITINEQVILLNIAYSDEFLYNSILNDYINQY